MMGTRELKITENEKRTVLAVFGALLEKPQKELNTFLGSITIDEMSFLYQKLKYEDYCNRHGIAFEQMTEEDFRDAYEEACNQYVPDFDED